MKVILQCEYLPLAFQPWTVASWEPTLDSHTYDRKLDYPGVAPGLVPTQTVLPLGFLLHTTLVSYLQQLLARTNS